MRLYGSLNNRLAEHATGPAPKVGDGATLYAYTDRYAGTVTAVSASGATVTITEDTVTEWKPYPSGYAVSYAPNPNGRVWVARRNRKGVYRVTGGGLGVTFGARAAYRDPGF